MDQIKNILRTYQVKELIKTTASTLQLSKNTVRHYLRKARAHSVNTMDSGENHATQHLRES
jgi:hypothetical protein